MFFEAKVSNHKQISTFGEIAFFEITKEALDFSSPEFKMTMAISLATKGQLRFLILQQFDDGRIELKSNTFDIAKSLIFNYGCDGVKTSRILMNWNHCITNLIAFANSLVDPTIAVYPSPSRVALTVICFAQRSILSAGWRSTF